MVRNMPGPYNSIGMTFNKKAPLATRHDDRRGPRIRNQNLQSAAPNPARNHVPLPQDPTYLSALTQAHIPSKAGDLPSCLEHNTSSVQGSSPTVGSQQKNKQRSNSSYLPRGPQDIPPPYGFESDLAYETKGTSSHAHLADDHISNHQTIAPGPVLMSQSNTEPLTQNASDNARSGRGRSANVQTLANGQSDKVPPQKGADKTPKGLVRNVRGYMEHREANENSWKPAIYHEELRDVLIAEANLLGAYGKSLSNNFFEVLLTFLDHPRERGIAANDITSYLPSQKEWGPDRDLDWPKVENNVLHRFERKDYQIPAYNPDVWYDAGRIVLDMDNHPILKYKVIPATLSSEFSGRDMEAIKRLDLRISSKDFRARMPSTILTKDRNKPQQKKPLYTLSALSMRTSRFRDENGLISWTKREGSGNVRQYRLDRMSDANIAANSTQGMVLPTLFEQGELRTLNKGQHLNRAGGRALSDDTRRERAKNEQQRLAKLHAADIEAAKQAAVPNDRKRKREDNLSVTEPKLPQSKRVRHDFAPRVQELISEVTPFPDTTSQFGMYPSMPATRGYKRSREEFLTDDEVDLESQSKRLKTQPIHAQLKLVYTQPTADLIKRPKALMPRLSHRRPRGSIGGKSPETRLCSHTTQIQPKPIPCHHFEENRKNDSIDFNVVESGLEGVVAQDVQSAFEGDRNDESINFHVEDSGLEVSPAQDLHSVETRLWTTLTGWLAQHHQEATGSTPGDKAD